MAWQGVAKHRLAKVNRPSLPRYGSLEHGRQIKAWNDNAKQRLVRLVAAKWGVFSSVRQMP